MSTRGNIYASPGNGSRGTWKPADLDAGGKLVRSIRKPWKAPRLYAEGRPFEPSGVEPGAFVGIREGDASAIGQVWSASPRGVWVVVNGAAVEVCTRTKHTPHLCGDLAHLVAGGAS